MGLIDSMPYRPQTSGRLERFQSLEGEIRRRSSPDGHVECCNTDRLHSPLDTDNCETPLMAFGNETDETRRQGPKRMRRTSMAGGQDGARHDFHILHVVRD